MKKLIFLTASLFLGACAISPSNLQKRQPQQIGGTIGSSSSQSPDQAVPASGLNQVIYTCEGSTLYSKGADQKVLDFKMVLIENAVQNSVGTTEGTSYIMSGLNYSARISIWDPGVTPTFPTQSLYTAEFKTGGTRKSPESLDSIAQSMPTRQGDFQNSALHIGAVQNIGLFTFDQNTQAPLGRALFIIRSSRNPAPPLLATQSSKNKSPSVPVLANKDLKLNITAVLDYYQLNGEYCTRSENIQK